MRILRRTRGEIRSRSDFTTSPAIASSVRDFAEVYEKWNMGRTAVVGVAVDADVLIQIFLTGEPPRVRFLEIEPVPALRPFTVTAVVDLMGENAVRSLIRPRPGLGLIFRFLTGECP